MDVTALPFNRLLGLEPATPGSGFLVSLPDGPQYTNHLGTVHASALLAAAEAGSGVFLVRQFGEASGYLPVVRRLEAKFRKPARGRVAARVCVPAEEMARWSSELKGLAGVSWPWCRSRSWTVTGLLFSRRSWNGLSLGPGRAAPNKARST